MHAPFPRPRPILINDGGHAVTQFQARVDEHFVRQHVLALRLRRLLTPHDFQTIRLPDYRRLLDEVRRELARESAAHTDEHPNVVALKERADRLEAVVAEERASAGASYLVAAERRELGILEGIVHRIRLGMPRE